MTMEEAVRRVRQLCPDATYTNASVSFDFDVDKATCRAFSLHALKRDYVDARTIYSYNGCGSCWHEAVEKLTAQVQGTQDLKETIAETDGGSKDDHKFVRHRRSVALARATGQPQRA